MANQPEKPNIIEMAKKRRHLHLVKKMHEGKTLSGSELKELKKFEGPAEEPGIVDTQEDVARVFGITPRQVQNWCREWEAEGITSTRPDGKYSIAEIQTWRLAKKKSKTSEDDDDDPDKQFRRIKARRELLRLQQEEGEVITREEVETQLIEISVAAKRLLLSWPRTLVHLLHGKDKREIQATLTKKVKEVILKFETGKIFGQINGGNKRTVQKTKKTDQHTINLD